MKSTVIKCDAYRNRSSIVCASVVKGKEVVGKQNHKGKIPDDKQRQSCTYKNLIVRKKTNKNKAVDKIREMTYDGNNN